MPSDCMLENKVQYVTPKTTIHKFGETLLEKKVIFQIVNMNDTTLIYINETDQPCCTHLDMAMNTRFSSNPSTTSLLGPKAEHPGTNMAGRISKKLNKTVYLSLNLEDTRFLIPLVEKRLNQELNQFPDKF